MSAPSGSCPTCNGWAKTSVKEIGGAIAYRCAQGHTWRGTEAAIVSGDAHEFALEETKVFVAGPFALAPDQNFPAFEAAVQHLRRFDLTVVSQHELLPIADLERTWEEGMEWVSPPDYRSYLLRDLGLLAEADVLALVTGWEENCGCDALVTFARACGINVMPMIDLFDLLHGLEGKDAQ